MPGGPRRATGKRPERELSAAIIRLLQAHGIMAWRTGGGAFKIDGRYVRMGTKGVSDVLGVIPTAVNGNMALVGRTLAIEAKSPVGRIRPEQTAFLADVVRHGGIAFIARSVDDVVEKLNLGAR